LEFYYPGPSTLTIKPFISLQRLDIWVARMSWRFKTIEHSYINRVL
jgi:hypothetical protein